MLVQPEESEESEESILEVVFELSKDDLKSRKENLPSATGVQESATSTQLRRVQRYRILNEIMSTYAAFEVKAKALARAYADDPLKNLEEILRYSKLPSVNAPHQSFALPAPRPELAKK
nr:unnamed protein product [Haemonchus contortus]